MEHKNVIISTILLLSSSVALQASDPAKIVVTTSPATTCAICHHKSVISSTLENPTVRHLGTVGGIAYLGYHAYKLGKLGAVYAKNQWDRQQRLSERSPSGSNGPSDSRMHGSGAGSGTGQ